MALGANTLWNLKKFLGASAIALLAAGPLNASVGDGFWIGGGQGGHDHGSWHRGEARAHEVEVDHNAGPYRTINEGIRAAGWGGIVRVHPGIYVESLDIKHAVTIVGLVNEPGEFPLPVKIQAPPDRPCVNVDAEGSAFVGLSQVALQAGTQNVQRACVELQSGYLAIKDSTIVAPSYVSAVLARGGHLSIETTSIGGGREGVLITSHDSTGTYYLVNDKITGNITGVKIDGLAQANIVGNDISHNSNDGVIYFQGRGSIIGNDIHHNARSGLVLQDSPQSPTVKANKIFGNVGAGIEVVPSTTPVTSIDGRPIPVSKGEICDNLIVGNRGAGIDSKVDGLTFNCKNDLSDNHDKDRHRDWQRNLDQ